MPYVIDVQGAAGAAVATLQYLVFDRRFNAERFCKMGNLRERHRSGLVFTYRYISPTEDELPPAPWPVADPRP